MPHQDSGVVELQRVARSDLLEAKLRVPVVRPGSVPRSPLLKRLQASGAHSFVVVLAPAGYGKTTMLAQWAARDGRPFAWVSIDGDDNDPVVLTSSVAAALSRGPARRLVGRTDDPATDVGADLGRGAVRAGARQRARAQVP